PPGRPEPPWEYKLKLSDEPAKTTSPGVVQVRRFRDDEAFVADMIYDRPTGLPDGDCTLIDVEDAGRRSVIPGGTAGEHLLVPVLRDGELLYDAPSLDELRRRVRQQLAGLPEGVKRLTDPQPYPVGLEGSLHELKMKLIREVGESRR
ncbi:MAG: nicotinate phosphoribosyltransferase, partial [Phycisphaerae bacterium]